MIKPWNGLGLYSGPFAVLAALLVALPASAQVIRPDSIRRDSTVRRDSTQVIADSAQPPRIIVKHTRGAGAGFGAAIWIWERDDLLREGALTLSDLLQQIPSVLPFRTGLVSQPEIASAFAQTRGRVQVFLDGYELDPLFESTLDLARIELANLERVRVERRLDLTRIDLSSLEPSDGRPHSRIEAGVGEPDTNLFRGVFLAPRLFIGPLGFSLERIDSDGWRRREPVESFNGWGKWAFIRGGFGLQAEVRQTRLDRQEASPWVGLGKRRDLIVRGRAQLTPGLVAEAFFGQSKLELDTTTIEHPDTADITLPERAVQQFGGRASFDHALGWLDATARFRNTEALPKSQLDVSAGLRAKYGLLAASFSQQSWEPGGAAASYNLRASSAPFAGITAFAEIAGGDRAGPAFDSIAAPTPGPVFISNRTAQRVGAGYSRWGAQVDAALIKIKSDSTQSFGLPFDSTNARFRPADVTGWEIGWRVPLFLKGLSTFGSATNWPSGIVPIYLPNQSWRAGLEYHNLPLKSGNLELLGRIEMRHRGELLAPAWNATNKAWDTTVLPIADQIDGYMQIRIIDLRIFLRAENLSLAEIVEVPGRTITGMRIMYGIKWQFWN